MTQPTPEAVHLRAAASQLRSVYDWMETSADVLDRTAAEHARQDGHTGAQDDATGPGDPEPTEHENGAQTGVQHHGPACARPTCRHSVDHHIYDAHTRSLRECELCNCPEPPEPAQAIDGR